MAAKARPAGRPSSLRAAKIAVCQASPPAGARRRRRPRAPRGRRAGRRRGPPGSSGSIVAGRRVVPRPERRSRASRARPRAVRRGSPVRVRSAGSPSPTRPAPTTSTPGIWTRSARCANGARKARRLGRDIGVGVEERVPERRLVTRRDLALDLATGGRRRIPVELVEETRDRVGAVRARTRSPGSAVAAGTGTEAARAG